MMAMFGCCVHNQPRGEPCGLCPDGKAVIANVSENLALDLPEALAAHRELADGATPGPKSAEAIEYLLTHGLNAADPGSVNVLLAKFSGDIARDAAFIAANSPERIAALIDVAKLAIVNNPTYRMCDALDRLKAAYKEAE